MHVNQFMPNARYGLSLALGLTLLCAAGCRHTATPTALVGGPTAFQVSDYGLSATPIRYSWEGAPCQGHLFFVRHRDREMPLYFTTLYLLSNQHPALQLVGDTAAFANVYETRVSPDNSLLALYYVSEGHPWIELYHLPSLIERSQKLLLAELNPYPGTIQLLGWHANKLKVSSDVDLLKRNTPNDTTEVELFDRYQTYFFDPITKQYGLAP